MLYVWFLGGKPAHSSEVTFLKEFIRALSAMEPPAHPAQVTKARDLEIMEEKARTGDVFMHFLPGLRRSKTCQAALFREGDSISL